jgi:beta-lactamase class A
LALIGAGVLAVSAGVIRLQTTHTEQTIEAPVATVVATQPSPTAPPATYAAFATLIPVVAPTIVPVPTPRQRATPTSSRADVRAQIESAMRVIAPLGSAEVIANAGSLVAAYQATQPRTAASTIKLPLLVEVLRQQELGKLDLSRRATIHQQDVVGGTGDLQYQVGHTLTLQEIVEHMVLRSDNVAANVLIDTVGMDGVNATMHANDFPNTFLRRRMLDTRAQAAGVENLTSAADLADMLERMVRGILISASVSQQALSYLDERGRIDKNWLGLKLPSGTQLSHINGTLAGVRNDVGLITGSSGMSFVLAVCQDHLTSDAAGETAIADLARRVFDILDAG